MGNTISSRKLLKQNSSPVARTWLLPKYQPKDCGLGGRIVDKLAMGLDRTGVARPLIRAALAIKGAGRDPKLLDWAADNASTMLRAERIGRKIWLDPDAEARENLLRVRLAREISESIVELDDQTAFSQADFVSELEDVSGAQFRSGNKVNFLFDGSESFSKRFELMDQAQSSIHIMMWGIYNDETGREFCKKLAQRAAEGIDVKLIINRNLALREGEEGTLELLRNAGAQIIYWAHPDNPAWNLHSKIQIVDGYKSISGGMNIGDYYSHGVVHQDPSQYKGQKWRDTDIYLEGSAVVDQQMLFARTWNEQIALWDLTDRDALSEDAAYEAQLRREAGTPGRASAAIVSQKPEDVYGRGLDPTANYKVVSSIIKAISGATRTLDIENAYFLRIPGIDEAIQAALMRGVRVRILTNSQSSVDEPLIESYVLEKPLEYLESGAKVYMKLGDTLHSKFLIVDDSFVSLGSFNFHQRSCDFDTESNVSVISPKDARKLRRQFETDISNGNAEEITLTKNAGSRKLEYSTDRIKKSDWLQRFMMKYFHRHI